MIKLRRLGQHNLEIRDEDDTHRGGLSGPVAIIDAFMQMQEQAERYRADSLFAAAGVTATTPSEKETARRWWALGQGDIGSNFEVSWAREQARNRQKQEAHTTLQDGLTAEYVELREQRKAVPSADDEPCVGDYVLPRATIKGVPLDMLVSMWLSDQLSWKAYTDELKRRGFKPEEVAAAREEQYLKKGEPDAPTEDGVSERAKIAREIDAHMSVAHDGRLAGILRRILART